MSVQIRKARRSATKWRQLITGPSGSGKTWASLHIAPELGSKIVVIDTEEGSSDLYDHITEFDVIDLRPPFSPERYIEAIDAAEKAGYEVIIIDSVTHCWNGPGGVLELLEDIAKANFKGNTWAAWNVMTPRWRKFVDRIIHSPAHMICTGRSKTETVQSEGSNGKKRVEKLGMKLEARDGLEYEFTCVLDLVHNGHYATVSKDRTGLFSGDPKPITRETGKAIAAWLAGGHELKPVEPVSTQQVASKPEPSAADNARVAIANARSVDRLESIRKLIDSRHAEGVFDDAVKSELVTLCLNRTEEIMEVAA